MKLDSHAVPIIAVCAVIIMLGIIVYNTSDSDKAGAWEYEVACSQDADLDRAMDARGAAGWQVESARRVTDCLDEDDWTRDAGYEFVWGRPA